MFGTVAVYFKAANRRMADAKRATAIFVLRSL
jgi:hypothetical protein